MRHIFCVCYCCCCCCSDVAAVEAGLVTLHEVTAPGLTPFLWSPEAGRGWPGGHCTGARRRLQQENALAAASQNHSELRSESDQIRLNPARLSQQQIIFGLPSHSKHIPYTCSKRRRGRSLEALSHRGCQQSRDWDSTFGRDPQSLFDGP